MKGFVIALGLVLALAACTKAPEWFALREAAGGTDVGVYEGAKACETAKTEWAARFAKAMRQAAEDANAPESMRTSFLAAAETATASYSCRRIPTPTYVINK